MYNINKGGNTFNESEILEPIHTCLRELLDIEKQNRGSSIQYTDDDVIAVTLLYSQILGSRFIEILDDEKVGVGFAKEVAESYGAMIRELTLAMSRVDTTVYYKPRGKDQK